MAEFPLWAAISTIKQKLSGRAGLAAYRAGGGKVSDSTWYKMVGIIRDNASRGVLEPTKPLNQKPQPADIGVMPVKAQTGYLQNVSVIMRDKVTGITRVRPYSIATDELITRADAVDTAIEVFQRNAFGYEETVMGAVYSGTVMMVPRDQL